MKWLCTKAEGIYGEYFKVGAVYSIDSRGYVINMNIQWHKPEEYNHTPYSKLGFRELNFSEYYKQLTN